MLKNLFLSYKKSPFQMANGREHISTSPYNDFLITSTVTIERYCTLSKTQWLSCSFKLVRAVQLNKLVVTQ